MHHVGGRGGSRNFPYMKKFEKDIITVLYDADKDCIEQIKDANRSLESDTHVLPYALSNKCKSTVLNINYDPYTSSLLESNSAFDSFYMFNNDHDYIMGEATKAIEKRKIDVVSIDHIFNTNNIPYPKPDFLSLDVEGGEYDILKGSIETMKSSILAIDAEVTFHPFRKGQKNFGEICEFLSNQGFSFVSFANNHGNVWMQEMSPYRYPIGLRGKGFHTLSEALFLRKIDVVNNLFSDPVERYINLRKLAFISIAYNQIEYSLECLRQSRMIYQKIEPKPDIINEPNYLKFLNKLELAEKEHPKLFPKTFKSLYTYEMSKSRFNSEKWKFKILLKKIPGLVRFNRFLRFLFNTIPLIILKLKKLYLSSCNSDFEKVFIKYGLLEQYKLINKNRTNHQPYT